MANTENVFFILSICFYILMFKMLAIRVLTAP